MFFTFSILVTYTCQACKKVFKRVDRLRQHKQVHALHKPVLVCPKMGCQAYFSTTFNLQHHIRKVHLKLLKHRCSFPDCQQMFAMRVSNTPKAYLDDIRIWCSPSLASTGLMLPWYSLSPS